MKAQIHITGQTSGNSKLKSIIASNGNYSEIKGGIFNSYFILFDTVGEAKKAMRKAFREIKNEDDSLNWHDGLTKDGNTLTYDASKAVIFKYYN